MDLISEKSMPFSPLNLIYMHFVENCLFQTGKELFEYETKCYLYKYVIIVHKWINLYNLMGLKIVKKQAHKSNIKSFTLSFQKKKKNRL